VVKTLYHLGKKDVFSLVSLKEETDC